MAENGKRMATAGRILSATVSVAIMTACMRHIEAAGGEALSVGERVGLARAFGDGARAGYIGQSMAVAESDPLMAAYGAGFTEGVRLRRDEKADAEALRSYGATLARHEARRLGVEGV